MRTPRYGYLVKEINLYGDLTQDRILEIEDFARKEVSFNNVVPIRISDRDRYDNSSGVVIILVKNHKIIESKPQEQISVSEESPKSNNIKLLL